MGYPPGRHLSDRGRRAGQGPVGLKRVAPGRIHDDQQQIRRHGGQCSLGRMADPRGPSTSSEPRHLVVVVLDSLRYDTWIEAAPNALAQLGEVERRWSYASWTAPSHYNLLMGLLPHTSPPEVYASEYYKRDFSRYAERLGVPGIEFKSMLPSIFLPTYLKHSLGYMTQALVSMPVLNPHTPINRDFDTYELMPTHNDMAAMLPKLRLEHDRPGFSLLNVGETHYPYAIPGEDPEVWPRISGVHGVFRRLDERGDDQPHPAEPREFFDEAGMRELRERQVRAVEYLDAVFARLFDLLPSNTWVIVTSDHGELFGEDRHFGHGPVMHEKVFEVPFVEGVVP